MKRSDYEGAKARLEARVQTLESQLAQYRGDLEALERLWERVFQPAQPDHGAPNGALVPLRGGPVMASLSDAVQDYSAHHEGAFSASQIAKYVEEHYPQLVPEHRSSYSKALRRMTRRGELVQVEPGTGTKPSTYRLAENGGAP